MSLLICIYAFIHFIGLFRLMRQQKFDKEIWSEYSNMETNNKNKSNNRYAFKIKIYMKNIKINLFNKINNEMQAKTRVNFMHLVVLDI